MSAPPETPPPPANGKRPATRLPGPPIDRNGSALKRSRVAEGSLDGRDDSLRKALIVNLATRNNFGRFGRYHHGGQAHAYGHTAATGSTEALVAGIGNGCRDRDLRDLLPTIYPIPRHLSKAPSPTHELLKPVRVYERKAHWRVLGCNRAERNDCAIGMDRCLRDYPRFGFAPSQVNPLHCSPLSQDRFAAIRAWSRVELLPDRR